MTIFFIISIGFNEIKNGYKNSRRLKLYILVCILLWISLMRLHILLNVDNIYFNYINNEFLPDNFIVFYSIAGLIIYLLMMVIRTKLISEINSNLSPLKILYYLMNNNWTQFIGNWNSRTEFNVKKIRSRIFHLLFIH